MNKFLIIGLDGATFNLLNPWTVEGKLPNFKRLIEEGVHGPLESTTPPISSAAWVSFMTGLNPGKHGVCKFEEFNAINYYNKQDYVPVTSEKFSGRTMFDIVSDYGRKVISVAVPLTYPAWEVNGMMVSGWPIPDSAGPERIFPRYLYKWREQFPEYQNIKFKEREKVISKLLHNINRRFLQVKSLMQKEWDLFAVVLGETDQAQHCFWRYMEEGFSINTDEEREKFGDVIFKVYSFIDGKLGEILLTLPKNTQVIIMSDHGGCLSPRRLLRLNHWLRSKGFLKSVFIPRQFVEPFKYLVRKTLDKSKGSGLRRCYYWDSTVSKLSDMIVWKETRAYAVPLWHPVGGIAINLKGREGNGCVEPGREYNALCRNIIDRLLNLKDGHTGEQIIVRACKREDLYRGEYLQMMPDIVFEVKGDYHLDIGLNYGSIVYNMPERLINTQNGQHDMNGVLILWGNHAKKGEFIEGAKILDLAPTILYGMGIPIPRDMDGKVLKGLFSSAFVEKMPVRYTDRTFKSEREKKELTVEEVDTIKNQLRNLGYI